MTRKTVYIETSVVSYLTARPTNNLLLAAWQKVTSDWWDTQRKRFDLCTSNVTLEEAGRGDPKAAERRLEALSGVSVLPITEAVVRLSKALVHGKAVPNKALDDALHIAISAVHDIDYLLTWNFRHLDNAETKPIIRSVCNTQGYTGAEICTPQELMGGFEDV